MTQRLWIWQMEVHIKQLEAENERLSNKLINCEHHQLATTSELQRVKVKVETLKAELAECRQERYGYQGAWKP